MPEDDRLLFAIRKDISGGINTRQEGSIIGENQVVALTNADIITVGETRKRPGNTLVEDLGDDVGAEAFGFQPDGSANELVVTHGTKLETYPGTGTFTERKTDFTSVTAGQMFKVGESGEGDVLAIQNGTDNAFRMLPDYTFQDLGDTNTSPPLSLANTYWRNRWWVLLGSFLYYSDAYPADYSLAFDRSNNNYGIPCGEERAVIGSRDLGLVCLGADSVWAINPSATPVATDKAEKIVEFGCAEGKTAVQVGDDILYLSYDGVRGLFRSQQDKLQSGSSFPLSYSLKTEFEDINFAQIAKARAVYFDNKYFLALPTGTSLYNNKVWVYYPATQGWSTIDGWNVGAWAVTNFDGEDQLFYIDADDASVYQAWTGQTDNGTAIDLTITGRQENLGQPLTQKNGGEVRITALTSGDYDLTISISLDGDEFQTLGTMDLSSGSPALPVSLPFDLAGSQKVVEVFPLDEYGPWETAQIKITNSDINSGDEIKVFEITVISMAGEYEPQGVSTI